MATVSLCVCVSVHGEAEQPLMSLTVPPFVPVILTASASWNCAGVGLGEPLGLGDGDALGLGDGGRDRAASAKA